MADTAHKQGYHLQEEGVRLGLALIFIRNVVEVVN